MEPQEAPAIRGIRNILRGKKRAARVIWRVHGAQGDTDELTKLCPPQPQVCTQALSRDDHSFLSHCKPPPVAHAHTVIVMLLTSRLRQPAAGPRQVPVIENMSFPCMV